jgi:spermidine synthase
MVLEAAMNKPRLLYYETGRAATVAVMEEESGVRFLTVNGKTDASAGSSHDMKTQVMLGHLPMLLHGDPRRVLMVGLGSGISAGSVLAHGVGVLDCAEISPAVIAASRYFHEFNRGVLDDPRLRVAQRDARNFLLTAREGYDVVISQPSNPWIEGESNLFTEEWYRLVHSRLREGGMMLQWLPGYLMSEEDFRTILHTFRTVFPSLTLWASGSPGDVFLLATKGGPVRPDLEAVRAKLADPEIRGDITRTGLDPDNLLPPLFRMGPAEVAAYISAGGGAHGVNTDDLPLTEFTTPKQLIRREQVGQFDRAGDGVREEDWISMMQAGAALPDEGASPGPESDGEEI